MNKIKHRRKVDAIWREKNREHLRKYQKEWRANLTDTQKTERLWGVKRHRHKKKGTETIPAKIYADWWVKQKNKCFYCERVPSSKLDLETDRLNSEEGYALNNICLACSECNRCKNNVFTAEQWKEIAQKYLS